MVEQRWFTVFRFFFQGVGRNGVVWFCCCYNAKLCCWPLVHKVWVQCTGIYVDFFFFCSLSLRKHCGLDVKKKKVTDVKGLWRECIACVTGLITQTAQPYALGSRTINKPSPHLPLLLDPSTLSNHQRPSPFPPGQVAWLNVDFFFMWRSHRYSITVIVTVVTANTTVSVCKCDIDFDLSTMRFFLFFFVSLQLANNKSWLGWRVSPVLAECSRNKHTHSPFH